ncbi:zinc finger protein-like [Tropilaelaps mercedesae]|uniref:Zinc finger protein-like n=1 Tax=Tropilaelaps mercedesae TaxID=418985 RepID=A0A1V9XEZ4_9ACAR|nr:zinc finger protein-like [Tropilaelaps mercedesae]
MSLVRAEESCNSERPFKCPLCDYSAKTKYRIKEHIIDHSKSFVCDVCQRGFGRKSSLQQHLVSQHGLHQGVGIKACGKR